MSEAVIVDAVRTPTMSTITPDQLATEQKKNGRPALEPPAAVQSADPQAGSRA